MDRSKLLKLVPLSPGTVDPFWNRVAQVMPSIKAVPLQMSVVCFEPLIVVLQDGQAPRYDYIYYETDSTLQVGFGLPGGAVARTTIPISTNLSWLSPDLDGGPIPVGRDADGNYQIPVSWGRLLLLDTGSSYEVVARSN